ncbi:MAG TPA: MFS transporter [Candidatus Marinimicrobia bacterium]|nr:MFS transporter [Candidatus Neomarinimicrobiota bacterium]
MDQKKDVTKNPLKEIIDPFINLIHAPRALWGINLSYLLEGLTYFGVLGLLTIYFNQYIGLNDIEAGRMVGILTAGITLSMLFLGGTVDWIGVRKALLIALSFMLFGRVFLALAPTLGISGPWASAHWLAMLGILGIVIGYGIYQPACYTAIKQFTTARTAAMGYAMLYAIMNLGGFLPGLISPPIRKRYEIIGVYWVFAAFTVVGILIVAIILSKKTVKTALANAAKNKTKVEQDDDDEMAKMSKKEKIKYYIKNFPIRDGRFMFFIFILIPVQTLFAHNWLTLPLYFKRAFTGVVSNNFEFFVNFNPLLIFILAPMVAALTAKKDTYKMMILGTFVMASPTFLLTLGPSIYTVFGYLIIMTIGEAMWQPRFLQWVAEIAPKNMTGIYMGIGQFPWFLTKIITAMYSGWFLMKYCPEGMAPEMMNTEKMWLIYGFIAILSPLALILAKGWMGKGLEKKRP